jgi:hypothetical protein
MLTSLCVDQLLSATSRAILGRESSKVLGDQSGALQFSMNLEPPPKAKQKHAEDVRSQNAVPLHHASKVSARIGLLRVQERSSQVHKPGCCTARLCDAIG